MMLVALSIEVSSSGIDDDGFSVCLPGNGEDTTDGFREVTTKGDLVVVVDGGRAVVEL